MIVDDTEDVRDLYSEFLGFFGFEVCTAENGSQAIRIAFERHPGVIVMDLAMPVMDGWEATRRLKAAAHTKDIPVLALTPTRCRS